MNFACYALRLCHILHIAVSTSDLLAQRFWLKVPIWWSCDHATTDQIKTLSHVCNSELIRPGFCTVTNKLLCKYRSLDDGVLHDVARRHGLYRGEEGSVSWFLPYISSLQSTDSHVSLLPKEEGIAAVSSTKCLVDPPNWITFPASISAGWLYRYEILRLTRCKSGLERYVNHGSPFLQWQTDSTLPKTYTASYQDLSALCAILLYALFSKVFCLLTMVIWSNFVSTNLWQYNIQKKYVQLSVSLTWQCSI